MDIATLGLRVDSSALRSADRDLDRFERSADEAGRSADRFGRTTSTMGANVRRAATQIVAAAGGLTAARQALQAAEQYRSITNGFIAMGQSADEAAATLDQIARIANDTRAPLEATADLYRRISTAQDDLGVSSQDVADFTETVGMALAASGTSAQEASGALTQLSQAMAGGTVRAEEFNSILEGAYPIALAAARGIEEAGGSVGKLREMVVAGEISSREFMEAVLSQQEQIRGAFEATTPTVAQAMQVLSNNFTMVIGGANEASGVTTFLADAIMFLAENLDTVIPVVAMFGAAAAVVVAPVLALAAAGAAAASYLVVNWDSLRERFPGITGAVEAAMGAMRVAFQVVKDVVINVVAAIEAVLSGDWAGAWESAKAAVTVVTDAIAEALPGVAEVVSGLVDAVKSAIDGDWSAAWETAKTATEGVRTAIVEAVPGIADAVGGLATTAGLALLRLVREMDQMGLRAVEALLNAFANLGTLIYNAIADAVAGVVARAGELVQEFLDIGRDMAQGLIDGFRSRAPNLGAEAAAMGRGAETAARRALETQSPSRVFRRIGEDVGDGLALGMESMMGEVEATARDIADSIVTETKDGLGDPASIGKGFVEGILGGMADGDLAGGLSGFLGNARSSFMDSPMMQNLSQGIGSALAPVMPVIGGISTAMNLFNGFSSTEKVGEEVTTRGFLGGGGGLFQEIEEEFKKTSFWGLKTSREIKTSFRDLNDETQQVRDAWSGLVSGVRDAGEPLGVVTDGFRKLRIPIVDGDIAGALDQADSTITRMIPGLSGLQQEGETVVETLERLSGRLGTYNELAREMSLPTLPGTVAGAGKAASILDSVDLGGASSAFAEIRGTPIIDANKDIARQMRQMGLSGAIRDADHLMRRITKASNRGDVARAAALASLSDEVLARDNLRARNAPETVSEAAATASGGVDTAAREAEQRADALTRQRITELELQERESEARKLELSLMEPYLRAGQERIWQLEDEAEAKREAEQAAQDAARAEEDLARSRESLAREVAGYQGFSTFREEQIATALAGRAQEGDELKDVLENLWATMRTIAANTGRQADDTSILVAQGVS